MFFSYTVLVLWLIFLGYWLIRAVGNKKTVYWHASQARTIMIIVLVVLFAYLYGTNSLGAALFQTTPALQIIGVIICALGIAFAIWARVALGANWNARPALKENHELVTSGPYAYARHPIYTGILFAFIGMFIGDGTVRMFVLLAVIAIGFLFRIPVEEKLMTKTFPNAYPEYKKRVKALVPFII